MLNFLNYFYGGGKVFDKIEYFIERLSFVNKVDFFCYLFVIIVFFLIREGLLGNFWSLVDRYNGNGLWYFF